MKKLKKVCRATVKSFSMPSGKTTLGVRGESQARKLKNLGQDMVIMQMNANS